MNLTMHVNSLNLKFLAAYFEMDMHCVCAASCGIDLILIKRGG